MYPKPIDTMATARSTSSLQHNLLITTPNAIYLYSRANATPLFECADDPGIVSAKIARDNSGLLAIADSHVVILYDTARAGDKGYVLKSGDGTPRILQFTPDSKTLIFTTHLSNSVQAYSISTAELLSPLHSHPSAPKVVAVCPFSAILLTTSAKPPTVMLQDLRIIGSTAISFRPVVSEAVVSCASFKLYDCEAQSSSAHFLLGFRDGTLALYRQPVAKLDDSKPEWRLSPPKVQLHQPIELYSFRRLHKPSMGGILAAEFLPGHRSRIVSLGYDGRCRLVDFTEKGELLRTWYVSGEATSLSIVPSRPSKRRGRSEKTIVHSGDNMDSSKLYNGTETLIAIGTRPGDVFVFNVLGLLIHEVSLSSMVIGVEWIGDMSASCPLPRRTVIRKPEAKKTAPLARPVLDLFLDQYEIFGEEKSHSEDETVRRVNPTSASSPQISPVQFGDSKGLSSPTLAPKSAVKSSSNMRAHDDYRVSYSSPVRTQHSAKRRRNSRSTSHIDAETSQISDTPVVSSLSTDHTIPTCPSTSPSIICPKTPPQLEVQDARRWPHPQVAPRITPVSGALQSSSEDVGAEDPQTDTDDKTMWFTPPTSNGISSASGAASPSSSKPAPESRRLSFNRPDSTRPEALKVKFSPGSLFTASPRKGGLSNESQSSPSRLRRLKRKGSRILNKVKDRRAQCRCEILDDDAGDPKENAVGREIDKAKLVQDNAELRSEMEVMRRDMQALKAMVSERRDIGEPVA